ncbi:MAG: stage V sporulation protein K, partial [Lentihominibacter sp.]|nr:stage V sporulation protein K [Lentihominibacter sp.]
VIFAGYPDKMESFLQKNPGLRSRITYHVPFYDYDTDSLCKIAELIAKKNNLLFSEGAYDKMTDIFENARTEDNFGNGRYVRNVIEKARMAQATRLLAMNLDSISRNDIFTICAEDIEQPVEVITADKKRIGFCV